MSFVALNSAGRILVDVIVVAVVVAVHTLIHRRNLVLGHRTGSNNAGVESYLKTNTNIEYA